MRKLTENRPCLKALTKTAAYVLLTASLVGCAAQSTEPLTVNPDALVLTPNVNNDINLDAAINVPANYINSRSQATIEPELILGERVAEKFEPITLVGNIYEKKAERLRVLYGQRPSTSNSVRVAKNTALTLPIRESIHLDDAFDSGKIVAYVTKDGCGECYGRDTIVIAYLSNLSNLIDTENLLVQWIDTVLTPEIKYQSGEGQARLQFKVDKWDILPEMANNAAEMDSMLVALTPVLKDSLSTLNHLSIFGSASAEGGYKHNIELARKRANAAKEWLDSKFHLTAAQNKKIKIGSEPEGWWPVVASMHAAGNPDSALVKEIILKYPDVTSFEAEKRIRKLACWPEIAEKHLAKDRRVIYKYGWTLRSFATDEEKVQMFETRPDAFSEEEFLRLAKIKENNPDSLLLVYETLVRYKPQSKIGINNLAVLYYNNGMYEKARRLLESQINPSDDMLTTLALCYVKSGDEPKAIEVLKGLGTDKAIYNLGVLQANNHQMADAYINLSPAQDLNTAIAALGVGENQEAWKILDMLNDNSEKANYVRAIAKARLGDADESIRYLKKAIADPRLRQRAITEADFMPLQKNWRFQQLFND